MKVFKFLLISLVLSMTTVAQVVVTVPQFSTENDSIKIIFDAAQGDQGLMGFTGSIYAHTGVITNNSASPSDWKHVIGQWGDNNVQPQLTNIGPDLYELNIGFPRQFYNVTNVNERILKLAFVFRNATGSITGRDVGGADIFADLFEPGIAVVLIEPQISLRFGDPRRTPVFAGQDDTVRVTVKAAGIGVQPGELSIVVNGSLVSQTSSDSLSYDFFAADHPLGFNTIQAIARETGGMADTTTLEIMVQPPPTDAPPPAGIQPGINYDANPTTVTLALFAPFKAFVYVIGDFNDWKVDPDFYMNRYSPSGDSTLWWMTIGVSPGTEYAFQYLVDGDLRIADPFTEKVLDPWNDSSIPGVTYPNLKAYPQGKTAEPASILQTAQASFTWQYSDSFQRPAKEELIIYELLTRDFIARHDYPTLLDTLDYLQNLGVNAIELMPFNEFEGNSSWGYNPSFYFAPDKYYGTETALKSFVDECHRRGMAVIMDMVLNHSFGQSPLVRMYWDAQNNRPSAENPWYNQVSPNPFFSFGFDFNHESPHTKAFVDRVNRHWLTEYRLDGYRFDFTKGFTNTPGDGSGFDQSRINILKRMADAIWREDSTAYVILEHFAHNSEEKNLANYGMLLWGNMNYNYNEATMGYHDNGKSDFSRGYYGARSWDVPHLVTYMESHDEERLMYKNLQFGNQSPDGGYNVKNFVTAINRNKMAAAFFLTYPGPKMIWQFGELGYDISIDNPCRVCEKPIRWEYLMDIDRNRLYRTYRALLTLRRENEVFRSPATQVLWDLAKSSGLKTISLRHPEMDVSIVGNFGVTTGVISGNFDHKGVWYDYFSGDSIEVFFPQQTVSLEPGEFHIFTDSLLPTPDVDLLTAIGDEASGAPPVHFELRQNYPNPFNPTTTIEFQIPVQTRVKITVFNLMGQQISVLADKNYAPGKHQLIWDARTDAGNPAASGFYFLQMKANGFVQFRRMLLVR